MLTLLLEYAELGFVQRALIACLLLSLLAAPVGCLMVYQRLSLANEPIAHATLPGVATAWQLFGYAPAWLLAGGLVSSLLFIAIGVWSGIIATIDRRIGGFHLAFVAVGSVIATINGGVPLDHLLFGSMFTLGWTQILVISAVTVIIYGVLWLLWRDLIDLIVDPAQLPPRRRARLRLLSLIMLATVIVVAVDAIGVLLAGGYVLLPVLVARIWVRRHPVHLVLCGIGFAAIASIVGTAIALVLDVVGGPMIVLTLAALWGASTAFSHLRWRGLRLVAITAVLFVCAYPVADVSAQKTRIRGEHTEFPNGKLEHITISNRAVELLLVPLLESPRGKSRITYDLLSPDEIHDITIAAEHSARMENSDLVVVLDERTIETGMLGLQEQSGTRWVRLRSLHDDRHFWHDPAKYLRAQHRLANALITTYPSHRAFFVKTRADYRQRVTDWQSQARRDWAAVSPPHRRFLMPFNDFGGYAQAFDLIVASFEAGGMASASEPLEDFDQQSGSLAGATRVTPLAPDFVSHRITLAQQRRAIDYAKAHNIQTIVLPFGDEQIATRMAVIARAQDLCLSLYRVHGDQFSRYMDYIDLMAYNTRTLQLTASQPQCE